MLRVWVLQRTETKQSGLPAIVGVALNNNQDSRAYLDANSCPKSNPSHTGRGHRDLEVTLTLKTQYHKNINLCFSKVVIVNNFRAA